MSTPVDAYFETLGSLPRLVRCSDGDGGGLSLDEAVGKFGAFARDAPDAGNKGMFIGNGGSAGGASPMAIDSLKNGNLRSPAFNDPSAPTRLGQDLGY